MKFKAFMQTCASLNYDPTWQPYEWAPGVHYFIGGIVINERCETGVAGLYAAGEAQSGTMGANRLPGNALTETQGFGAIAGAQAAGRALIASLPTLSPEIIGKSVQRIATHWNRNSGIDYREVKKGIRELMSRYSRSDKGSGVLVNEGGVRRITAGS